MSQAVWNPRVLPPWRLLRHHCHNYRMNVFYFNAIPGSQAASVPALLVLSLFDIEKSRMNSFRCHPGLYMELVMWLEHTTCWLRISCSTDWAMPAASADFLTACVFYHAAPPLSTEIAGNLHSTCGFCFTRRPWRSPWRQSQAPARCRRCEFCKYVMPNSISRPSKFESVQS